MSIFILVIIIILVVITLITMGVSAASLAPWVPAKKKDLARILRLADLKKDEIFYDIGCGDGRVANYIAAHSGGQAIGVELSFLFYLFCFLRYKLFLFNKDLKFILRNLFSVNLKNADSVFIFPASRKKLKGKLKAKLEDELKTGCRVITYVFPIEGWAPTIIDKPDPSDITIYLYKI